jgi:hypothetical protein
MKRVALALFAIAMGWLEAVVVIYIRAILGLAHAAPLPGGGDLVARMREHPWLLPTEQTREAATLVMLACVAWLAVPGGDGPGSAPHAPAPSRPLVRRRLAAFLIAFGIWDIAYYAALKVCIGWPPALTTLDVLFLLPPHPWWTQPVWIPLAASVGMIAAGLWMGRAATRRAPSPAS